jgi:hypothetical protein
LTWLVSSVTKQTNLREANKPASIVNKFNHHAILFLRSTNSLTFETLPQSSNTRCWKVPIWAIAQATQIVQDLVFKVERRAASDLFGGDRFGSKDYALWIRTQVEQKLKFGTIVSRLRLSSVFDSKLKPSSREQAKIRSHLLNHFFKRD